MLKSSLAGNVNIQQCNHGREIALSVVVCSVRLCDVLAGVPAVCYSVTFDLVRYFTVIPLSLTRVAALLRPL